MPTKEQVIRAALKAYPDSNMLVVDHENMTLEELLEAAKENAFGDGLISFIILELYEGSDEGDDKSVDLDCCAVLMERAVQDIQSVSKALIGMTREKGTT